LSRLKPDSDGGVDDAMNRVLGAEKAARDRVAACRDEAEAIVARAETEARAIARRAERRIRAAHTIADKGIGQALAELSRPEVSGDAAAPDAARVDAVVARLARELTEPGP
jgi:vacuolar-type H+-ATPase subunit H